MTCCKDRKGVSNPESAGKRSKSEMRFGGKRAATVMLVTLTMVCSAQAGLAESGAARISTRSGSANLFAAGATSIPILTSVALATPSSRATAVVRGPLELITLSSADARGIPPITALEMNAAIQSEGKRGIGKSIERASGFRKKSNDLFRAQWPVQVNSEEMLVRLRLRAKSRNAVSVELRF